MERKTEISELFDTVVAGGYCVGCGACAAIKNSPINIKFHGYGRLQASISGNDKNNDAEVLEVCPFSDKSKSEDQIGELLYASNSVKHDKIGYFLSTYAGHVIEDGFRENGSSGGMGTWIVTELLRRSLIDGVIHVHQRFPDAEDSKLFHYRISRSEDEILNGAKSRYYPIEMSSILKEIRENDGRYAIVGVPCFVKAVRLVMLRDNELRNKIKFCIGLVCGHLKSSNFAKMFAWEVGIEPSRMLGINFRTKLEGGRANHYGVTVLEEVDGKKVAKISEPVNRLFGTNWGWGFFKYKACDFCDDVVAETADLTIGDAWLPKYVNNDKGTNILIVRNTVIKEILDQAAENGSVLLENVTAEDVVRSQSSGFNHRREGLQYRLFLKDKEGAWRPKKRVAASESSLSKRVKAIMRLRITLSDKSHVAFKDALDAKSFAVFRKEMLPEVEQYEKLYKLPLIVRIVNKCKRIIR